MTAKKKQQNSFEGYSLSTDVYYWHKLCKTSASRLFTFMNISKNHAINSGFPFGFFSKTQAQKYQNSSPFLEKLKTFFSKTQQNLQNSTFQKIFTKFQPFQITLSTVEMTKFKIQMLKLLCQDTSQKNC